MKEKINDILNTKLKKAIAIYALLFIVTAIIFFVVPKPKYEKAYTRVATISCNTQQQLSACSTGASNKYNCDSECKNYKMLEQIIITKNKTQYYKTYDKNGKYTYILKDDVIFENTPDYEQARQEKAKYEAQSEKRKEETAKKRLSEIEPKIKKVFVKTNIRPELYYCYIKPGIWNSLNMSEKKQAFTLCAEYGKFKNNNPYEDANTMQIKTTIKSSATDEDYAKYSITSGIRIKK